MAVTEAQKHREFIGIRYGNGGGIRGNHAHAPKSHVT